MDRGAWRASVHRVAKGRTQLNDSHTHTHMKTIGDGISKVNLFNKLQVADFFFLFTQNLKEGSFKFCAVMRTPDSACM